MENWKTNLEVMAVKEEQYIQQYKKYEVDSFFF
jgi:HAUS augmin-like complex subunit 1